MPTPQPPQPIPGNGPEIAGSPWLLDDRADQPQPVEPQQPQATA